MGGSKAVIGAEKAILKDDIIKTVEQRYQRVKAEKARMIQEWKDSLTDLTTNAKRLIKEYKEKIRNAEREVNKGINVEENEKKIAELKKKTNELKKKKYTDADLKQAEREIMKDIMVKEEGSFCPFCGENFGSSDGVKQHLCEKEAFTDKDLEKMNTPSERSTNYAENYKAEHGTNRFTVNVPLEEFDNDELEIDIGEEIHHLISVGPYAFTLRINRLGNYFGIDINSTDNLISAPSVDPVAFKKKHGMAFSDLSDKSKYDIAAAAIEKSKIQYHKGNHDFEPEKGIPSYEKKLVQDLAEIEYEILAKSRKEGCLGQTPEGREEAKNLIDNKLKELQEKIKSDITDFEPSPDGKQIVERFLAKEDYKYHTGKG